MSLPPRLQGLSARVAELKKLTLLRTSNPVNAKTVADVDAMLDLVDQQLTNVKAWISEEKSQLEASKALIHQIHDQRKKIILLKQNIPKEIPKHVEEAPVDIASPKRRATASQPTVAKRVKTTFPTIDYIHEEEFGTVPKYMRGRLTVKAVNDAIDRINKAIASKYRVATMDWRKVPSKMRKKWREYKDQENEDTAGEYFIVDGDGGLCLTPSLRAIFVVLRHLKRTREVRGGGFLRYLVQ